MQELQQKPEIQEIEDIASAYSRKLDSIPGFRERTALPAPVEWARETPARRAGAWAVGASLVAGLATYAAFSRRRHHG